MVEKKIFAVPEYALPEDLKALREEMKLTQRELAELLGVSKPTVERWESSGERLTGPVAFLMSLLKEHPEELKRRILPPKSMPIRMLYMYRQEPCTMIDADEVRAKVEIVNFTSNRLFRAFGANEHPDFNDYREFLKSRCFPEERDKMKLVLKELGLPFYDPFLIIRKTEGRMAEDDFWIRIVE